MEPLFSNRFFSSFYPRPKKDGSNRPWRTSAVCFPVSTATFCLHRSHPRILRAAGMRFFSNFFPHGDSSCTLLRAVVNCFSVVKMPVILFSTASLTYKMAVLKFLILNVLSYFQNYLHGKIKMYSLNMQSCILYFVSSTVFNKEGIEPWVKMGGGTSQGWLTGRKSGLEAVGYSRDRIWWIVGVLGGSCSGGGRVVVALCGVYVLKNWWNMLVSSSMERTSRV